MKKAVVRKNKKYVFYIYTIMYRPFFQFAKGKQGQEWPVHWLLQSTSRFEKGEFRGDCDDESSRGLTFFLPLFFQRKERTKYRSYEFCTQRCL